MNTTTDTATIVGTQPKQRNASRFFCVCAGNFLVLLDGSVLTVALPDVRADLHAPAGALPWAVNAYTVVFAGLMLASGSVADRWGARRVYRVSLAAFAVLSALCAAAPNVGALIAGRALLGVAAAGMVPASLALLAAIYPRSAQRTRAVGNWAAVTTLGVISGPILGGLLVATGGWRLVFGINPPIAALAMLAAAKLPGQPANRDKPVDGVGIALCTLGLGALSYGLIDGGTSGWGRPVPLVAVLLAVLAFAALIPAGRRAAMPVLPAEFLRLPTIRVALLAATVASLLFYGLMYALTLWLQDQRGLTPLQTGFAFVPMTLPLLVLTTISGRVVARIGARPVIITGLAIGVVAGVLLSFAGPDAWGGWVIMAQLGLAATGPLCIPAAIAEVASSAPARLAATGQGALNASRQAGAALGVAVLGTMATLSAAGVVLAGFAAVTLVLVAFTRR